MGKVSLSNFKRVLEKEIYLSKKCYQIVDELKIAIENRDYDNLDNLINDFSAYSIKLSIVEEERAQVFSNLKIDFGMSIKDSFYDLIAKIEDPGNELGNLYSELRVSVSRMQSSIWVIDSYLKAMTATLNAVMENLCPSLSDGTYGQSGLGLKSKLKGSMVLDFSA